MESWPEQENCVQMMLAVPLAEAMRQLELPAKRTQRERTLKESQPAQPRQVLEKHSKREKLARPEIAPAV